LSPPAVGVAADRRRGPRTGRRRASGRRRLLLALVLATLAVVLAVVLTPFARKAINDLTLPLSHASLIRQQARAKQVDPALVAAVIYAESKFDPRPSSAGAQGLMQLMPQTAQFLARRSGGISFHTSDLANPRVNIAYGTYLLRYLIDHYGGNVRLALAAYNAGITNVDRWAAQARARGHTLTIGQIPYAETRLYVAKVLDAQKDYRRVYAKQLGY
jgi:soluble lytic murein transglycosylase